MLTHVILEIRKLDAFYLKEDACLCHLIDVKPVTLALVTPVVSGLSKTNFRNDYHVATMTHAVSLKPFMMPLSGNHLRGYLSCVSLRRLRSYRTRTAIRTHREQVYEFKRGEKTA